MKSRLYYLIPFFLMIILASCEKAKKLNIGPLTISSSYPKAGQKINVSYNTETGELGGQSKLNGTLYYSVKTVIYAMDIPLTNSGKIWKGTFTLPDSSQSFGLKFASNEKTDKNNNKGYIFPVYNRSGKSVVGALAAESNFYYGLGSYVMKIKANPDTALTLMKKEFTLHPHIKPVWRDNYLSTLLAVKKDTAYPVIRKQIKEMLSEKNVTEKDYTLAYQLYQRMRMRNRADSLSKVVLKKFPKGTLAQNKQAMAFSHQSNLDSLLAMYHQFKKQFSANHSNKSSQGIEMYMVSRIATMYAKEKQFDKFYQYASQISQKLRKSTLYNQVAWDLFQKNQNLTFADSLSKTALQLMKESERHPGNDRPTYYSNRDWKNAIHQRYGNYADTYAAILAKNGKYQEALPYQKIAVTYTKRENADINGRYALDLIKTGNYKIAEKEIEKFYENSKTTPEMKNYLKTAYTKINGSGSGFNEYYSSLEMRQDKKILAKLKKEMINKRAPAFDLPDLKGRHISLSSFRGKIVVVDFWATWCGPCKASFPAMKKTMAHYKNNSNVVFLYVDTWEHTNPKVRLKEVSQFISKHNYPFHVLLDQPQPKDSAQYSIVNKYGVSGIPTKFIIDPNGHIRFKSVGYYGSVSQLVKEVTTMIKMTKRKS